MLRSVSFRVARLDAMDRTRQDQLPLDRSRAIGSPHARPILQSQQGPSYHVDFVRAWIALIDTAILANQSKESPQVPIVPIKKTETSCRAPAFTACERSLVLDKGNLKRVALDWGT